MFSWLTTRRLVAAALLLTMRCALVALVILLVLPVVPKQLCAQQTRISKQETFAEKKARIIRVLNECKDLSVKANELADQGKISESAATRKRVISQLRQIGVNNDVLANELHCTAVLLSEIGEFAQAREYYEQAFLLRTKLLGENHFDTLKSLNGIAFSLVDMKDMKRARETFEKSLSLTKQVKGEKHPDTARANLILGEVIFIGISDPRAPSARQQMEIARSHYEKALAIVGEEHEMTREIHDSLSQVRKYLEDKTNAEDSKKEAALKVKSKPEP